MNLFKRAFNNKRATSIISILCLLVMFLGCFSLALNKTIGGKNDAKVAYADDSKTFIVNTNRLGPFDENSQNCTLEVDFESSVYEQGIIPRLRYGTNPSNLYASDSKASQNIIPGNEYSVDFTFPGYDLGRIGSLFFILDFIYKDTLSQLYEQRFTIYRIGKETLNLNAHLGLYWNSYILGFEIKDSKIIYYRDKLSTVDTIDYFNVDYYYRLDLSSICFTFDSPRKSYDKAEICFDDEYNLFPNFPKDQSDGEIHIPLTINMFYMPVILIQFKYGFYVNPTNLSMSSTSKSGYRPTNHFYFPVNQLDKIVEYKFHFKVFGIGWNKSDILLTLDYDVSKRLLGRCDISEYCIVGGVTS